MLDTVAETAHRVGRVTAYDVEIAAIATAVPENRIAQDEIRQRARTVYPQFAHVDQLYMHTGIGHRYFCQPTDWYESPHTWEERTAVFQKHALDLLERVTREAVAKAGLKIDEIDAIVVNTITGLAVPSLDARLMNRLPFSPNTERWPIFGIGCGGGVAGLSRAARIAQTIPDGNVLFLTVDLCSLCLRVNDPSMAMFVSLALFGDGAAAVVLRNSSGRRSGAPKIRTSGDHFWNKTEHIMGWDIKNDGFGIVLSPLLPALMQERFAPALDGFLDRAGYGREDIASYLLHPGGGKILDVADKILELSPDVLRPSRETLRDYGNMSSVTAMFVLKNAIETGRRGREVLAAFGPGFSAYFAILEL